MSKFKKHIKLNQEVFKIIDSLLSSGDWNTSLFLKVAGKQLYNLRSKAKALVEKGKEIESEEHQLVEQSFYQKPPLEKDQIELFIALYQSQGSSLDRWEEALRTLSSSSIGRPVYGEEAHVRKAIEGRGSLLQEGYAIVYVRQSDIIKLPESRETSDRFGHVLMSLTEHAIQIENIHEFVHANKKHYAFKEGTLFPIKQEQNQENQE